MLQNFLIMSSVVKAEVRAFFSDEKGEVNIVAIVVLIGIAVLLALFFQEEIETLLEGLFKTISTNATDAVGGTLSTGE